MLKTISLAFSLALGAASIAQAAMLPIGVNAGENGVERVAEGCGAGKWRDSFGHCHFFHTSNGHDRGTTHACPPGHTFASGRCVPI